MQQQVVRLHLIFIAIFVAAAGSITLLNVDDARGAPKAHAIDFGSMYMFETDGLAAQHHLVELKLVDLKTADIDPNLEPVSEHLEVTKTEDTADGHCDADCSLREAVIEANKRNDPTTITVGPGLYLLTRSGHDDTSNNGDLDINKSMVIVGAGAEQTIIDASGLVLSSDRVFDIHPYVLTSNVLGPIMVNISGFTVRNGDASGYGCGYLKSVGGGSRANNAYVTFTAMKFVDNNADCDGKSGYGGAISQFGGTLTIETSVIDNNTSYYGGGIFYRAYDDMTDSRVNLSNSSVQANRSKRGGGLYLEGTDVAPAREPMSVTVRNSIVSHNMVTGTHYALGGGIHFEGHSNYADTLKIEDSTLANNRAILAQGGYGLSQGGGIFLLGNLTMQGSTVKGNVALPVAPGGSSYPSTGGGIFTFDGHGVYTVEIANSRLTDNVSQQGGGFCGEIGRTIIVDSTVARNRAEEGTGVVNGGIGGGLYLSTRGGAQQV